MGKEKINIGDKVKIVDFGFATPNTNGDKADGRGWIRTVLYVLDDNLYQLINEETMVITGYYPSESIKKVKEEEEE